MKVKTFFAVGSTIVEIEGREPPADYLPSPKAKKVTAENAEKIAIAEQRRLYAPKGDSSGDDQDDDEQDDDEDERGPQKDKK